MTGLPRRRVSFSPPPGNANVPGPSGYFRVPEGDSIFFHPQIRAIKEAIETSMGTPYSSVPARPENERLQGRRKGILGRLDAVLRSPANILLRRLRGGTEKKQRPGYKSLVHHAPEVIFVLDADFTVRYASPSSRQVLGYQSGHYLGTGFVQHLHPEESARVLESIASEAEKTPDTSAPVLFIMRHADGSWRHIEAVCADLRQDPEVRGIACYVRDVTDRVKLQNLLYHRAFHDSLTGLPNRALLMDRIEQGLARTARHQDQLLAVLFIDLNNFKAINDQWGHAVGDQVLVTTGQRLRSCLRPSDTAARIGGDEFAVLLQETTGEEGTVRVAQRILQVLQSPIQLENHTLSVEVSVGIATTQNPLCRRAETLLQAADKAMYEAKATGGPGYATFKAGGLGNKIIHIPSGSPGRNLEDYPFRGYGTE